METRLLPLPRLLCMEAAALALAVLLLLLLLLLVSPLGSTARCIIGFAAAPVSAQLLMTHGVSTSVCNMGLNFALNMATDRCCVHWVLLRYPCLSSCMQGLLTEVAAVV
jgi:hypothetical protein